MSQINASEYITSGTEEDNQAYVTTSRQHYDVIVIGGGIAGCMTALLAARHGLSVLLVDAKQLGRDKVCGGCLNHRAWSVLQRVGLSDSISELAVPLNRLNVRYDTASAQWQMPTLHSISRRSMDPILVDAAKSAGAVFMDGNRAMVLPESHEPESQKSVGQEPESLERVLNDPACKQQHCRRVELNRNGRKSLVTGAVVVAADGLGHPSLARLSEFKSSVASRSHVGIGGLMLDHQTGDHYFGSSEGELLMACSRHGYVGICGVEKQRVNIAAAVSPNLLAEMQKKDPRNALGGAISHVLERSGVAKSNSYSEELFRNISWLATPRLTRRTNRMAGRRLFLVGDAAGYVEPFTGEGMAWAMQSAELLSEILPIAATNWSDELSSEWRRIWRTNVQPGQRVCRGLATLLRSPTLTRTVLPVAGRLKNLPSWLFPHQSTTSRSSELRQQMETA